ncbi:MAG: hypothetical protein JXB32_09890 [Deltaproteobacteria bacterium]|nr:hypothetical protein [Deltaproteobacteria bacterium]
MAGDAARVAGVRHRRQIPVLQPQAELSAAVGVVDLDELPPAGGCRIAKRGCDLCRQVVGPTAAHADATILADVDVGIGIGVRIAVGIRISRAPLRLVVVRRRK